MRSYAPVMLSIARQREWTTGRVFFRDGKLNLIIGEYEKHLDKGKENVEGSFGVTDDFRDVTFKMGSRDHQGSMPGRIVNTPGVEYGRSGDAIRPDWVILDVKKAALAYRQAQTPVAEREKQQKAKAEAAKLILERREMREEMARMRKELHDLKAGKGAVGNRPTEAILEQRLSTLRTLHEKGLISDQEYKKRKEQILGDI